MRCETFSSMLSHCKTYTATHTEKNASSINVNAIKNVLDLKKKKSWPVTTCEEKTAVHRPTMDGSKNQPAEH